MWRRDTIISFVGSLACLLVTLLATAIWGALRLRLALYDPVLLLLAIGLFVVCFCWEVWAFCKSGELNVISVCFVVSAAAFVILTTWGREEVVKSGVPIFAAFGLLLFTTVYRLSHRHHSTSLQQRDRERVGYATTGVVICNANPQSPYFVLVFNRNLRGGEGLWVPPGGHFTPHFESPEDKLLEKVEKEIGVGCKIIHKSSPLGADLQALSSEHTKWLAPPWFLLDEDLMGRCSYGHEIHIDLVYVLVTDGVVTHAQHKYPRTQQIHVLVAGCKASFADAESAIASAIEAWHVENRGTKPSMREGLAKDVAWRLHLVATIYSGEERLA